MRAVPRVSTEFSRKARPTTSVVPNNLRAADSVNAKASGRDSASSRSPLMALMPIIAAKPGSAVRLLSL